MFEYLYDMMSGTLQGGLTIDLFNLCIIHSGPKYLILITVSPPWTSIYHNTNGRL